MLRSLEESATRISILGITPIMKASVLISLLLFPSDFPSLSSVSFVFVCPSFLLPSPLSYRVIQSSLSHQFISLSTQASWYSQVFHSLVTPTLPPSLPVCLSACPSVCPSRIWCHGTEKDSVNITFSSSQCVLLFCLSSYSLFSYIYVSSQL